MPFFKFNYIFYSKLSRWSLCCYCDSHCAVVPEGCAQSFCGPTSLPDRQQIPVPGTSQPFLSCTERQGRVPGLPLYNYLLTVWFRFSVILRTFELIIEDVLSQVQEVNDDFFFFSLARVLTPSWILTILEHVVPVVPHGTFSVMTPKFSCTVLLPHLFFKRKDGIDLIMRNFMHGP